MNRPKPALVIPGSFSAQESPGNPPSDAVILFDGSNLDSWKSAKAEGGPAKWTLLDAVMEVKPGTGDIITREEFGDCQLHVEWSAPSVIKGESQGRGNSGIFLMGLCEVQVLDNFNNPSYADGYASSIYGVNPAMANALRPPGQFQTYDIVFRRPIYKDGKPLDPGYVTVFVNGVLTQDHTPLEGPTGHMKRTKLGPLPEKGPLKLQDHGDLIRFRNIWCRKLPPRAIEGGTDGWLTPEATLAKRAQIAADILADAAAKPAGSRDQILRMAESLCYKQNAGVADKVQSWINDYMTGVRQTPADKLPSRKDEIKDTRRILDYLARHNTLPGAEGPSAELEKLIKQNKWDK
jgi:hypothetical protein